MTAEEARRKSREVNLLRDDSQYVKIQDLINKATSAGMYETWFYENIVRDVKEELIKEGFQVLDTQFERDGPMTKITW